MIGEFWFKRISASTVGILGAGRRRVLRTATNIVEYRIPGRSGSIYYGEGTQSPFDLEVPIVLKRTEDKSIRELVREVEYFLQGSGSLIFDDEPDKEYEARVIQQVSLRELTEFGQATVVFHCQPFARSVETRQYAEQGVSLPADLELNLGGTAATPLIIRIKPTTPITEFALMRTKLD